jgi:GNAT superfamily N-acetyltransferase
MPFRADEFISFLPPPGQLIASYNRSLPPSEQPSSIPQLFLDAMTVRETVFVQEQHVPLDRELDADDARSYHWVVYASVSRRSSTDGAYESNTTITTTNSALPSGRRESDTSTAIRVPAGTIRLIPPIDPANPPANSAQTGPHPSHLSPEESYILLGRLAVCPLYRRLGLSKLLVNAVLTWARGHGGQVFLPTLTPAEVEARRLDHEGVVWKGSVVVHVQKGEAEKVWARMGFVVDEGMGEWDEEGITHVGIVRRLELPDLSPFQIVTKPVE